jgi:hypothetical protein
LGTHPAIPSSGLLEASALYHHVNITLAFFATSIIGLWLFILLWFNERRGYQERHIGVFDFSGLFPKCLHLSLAFFFFFLCGFLSIALIPSGMENPGLFCVFLGAGGLDNPRMPFAVLVLYHTGLGVF